MAPVDEEEDVSGDGAPVEVGLEVAPSTVTRILLVDAFDIKVVDETYHLRKGSSCRHCSIRGFGNPYHYKVSKYTSDITLRS